MFVLLRKYKWRLCLDQACIFAHTVESRFLVTQQIFGRIKLYFFALGQNQNFCVVKDGVEPVGNGDDGAIRELENQFNLTLRILKSRFQKTIFCFLSCADL